MASAILVNLGVGLVLSALVGYAGYRRGALSRSGWVGAIGVGTPIFGFGGWIAGLLLITFFVSSSVLSSYRRSNKQAAAEKFAKGGRRDAGQALANGGLAALLAIGHALWPDPVWFAGILGALATVNADTWGTELGVLSRVRPRLITTGRRVEPGTSGGITWQGIWAGIAGGVLIGLVAALLHQAAQWIDGQGAGGVPVLAYPVLGAVAGVAGSLFDSVLGATVQGIYRCDLCAKETEGRIHRCGQPARHLRGWTWLDNDWVNLLASGVGAGIAASLWMAIAV